MNRIKCSACGFVGFGGIAFCKKCCQPLNQTTETQNKTSVRFGIPTFTINGCGVSLIDYRKSQNGIFEVMKWVVILGVPLIPLSGWAISPQRFENTLPGTYQRYQFNIIDRIPLNPKRILRILAINVASVLPIIATIFFFHSFDKLFGLEWGGIIFTLSVILSIFWMIGLHWHLTDNGHPTYFGNSGK